VLAGALAAAAGLLASPRTYGRLRDAVGGGALRTGQLLAGESDVGEPTTPPPPPGLDPPPATTDPDVPARPAAPSPAGDPEAQQIRDRIESARARVHERARGGLSADR
jgi:hypothetical protein